MADHYRDIDVLDFDPMVWELSPDEIVSELDALQTAPGTSRTVWILPLLVCAAFIAGLVDVLL
jgi:hypothetical protein